MITRVGIVAKSGLAAAVPHLERVVSWLVEQGLQPVLETETAALMGGGARASQASRDELPRHVDLIVVLGGDGTLLSVADRIGDANCETPILGVNFGRLGFLTVRRDGEQLAEHVVLNDVVITRGTISRLIYLAVYVDDLFVTNVKADGLIVATPTGSTAYNLAAGGPIIHPGIDALLLTPIAPHSLGNRPIAVPGAATITVRAAADVTRGDIYVTFDGQRGLGFEAGDELTIRRAERPLRLVGSPTRGYYDTLREKLRWGD